MCCRTFAAVSFEFMCLHACAILKPVHDNQEHCYSSTRLELQRNVQSMRGVLYDAQGLIHVHLQQESMFTFELTEAVNHV